MDVLYGRCCGLDIHKKSIAACVIVPDAEGRPAATVRTFGTMTEDLLALADWLTESEVTHVAMESTGVYWKPIYNLLEPTFTLLLVNAQHVKTVPGRKTDVSDSQWLAELLRVGLLRPSFVPERPQRELRELTRYRTTLVRQRAAEVNRLEKTLEGANVKLAAVVSDLTGVSARQMLAALVVGNENVEALADLAKGSLRQKRDQLQRALTGRMGAHQRFMLEQQLAHVEFLDDTIERLGKEVSERLSPVKDELELLDTIPGIDRRGAEILLAEIGANLDHFPSARHLAKWAGVCPGNHESAGKRYSGKTTRGCVWLKTFLVQAAHAVRRTNTYLAAQFARLLVRRGLKKAALAVAHTILTIAYYVLKRGVPYQDLGRNYFDQRHSKQTAKRLIKRLADLGYKVTVQAPPNPQAA